MNIRLFFLTISAMMLTAIASQAVPAKPGVQKTMQLADGTLITVTLRGDEHFSFYSDDTNQPYVQRADGMLEPTTADFISEKWMQRRNLHHSLAGKNTTFNGRSGAPRKVGNPSSSTSGKHRGLVILMQFQDVPFVTENPKEVFTRFFNEKDFSLYGMKHSVKDYFFMQSYGKLDIDFDVVGPYTTTYEMKYYGAHSGDNHDSRPTSMVAEGVDKASKEVNFTNYDWDGDGHVDQVFVIYAGYSEAQGADENCIWPHEYSLAATGSTRRYNGKTINTYGCASELRGSGKSNDLDGIGTACHEFSHCLGLPDMYDTNYKNYGMGYWDVMDSGSYNGNSCTPAGYSSYERWFSGWMEPVELTEMTRVSNMKPLAEEPEAYILYNEANRNEYYLLENRQPVGFDAGLYGHGLMVLHVDYSESAWASNNVNTTENHERMTFIPADNTRTNSVNSLAGDPFPGRSGNTMLTNLTTPAATLYNKNVDGRTLMSKAIDNITEDVEAMTVSFVACRPELPTPSLAEATGRANGTSYTASWPAVSGAIGYEIELTETGSAPTNPEDALQREFTFDEFLANSVGFTDVSSNMSKYGLSGWTGSKLYTTPNKMRIGTSTTTGYVRTQTWRVPESSDMTIVMGADVVKAAVEGNITVAYGNQGESAQRLQLPFTVTANGKIVVHCTVLKNLFWLEIHPDIQMYLNYLAIYDGTWSEEQLGLAGAATRAAAPRRATTITHHGTTTNSYTFYDLNTKSRFSYRVRAIGEENTYSDWSEGKDFAFTNPDAISTVSIDTPDATTIYDLHGRMVSRQTGDLPQGVYIQGGKKMIVNRR